MLGFDRSNTKLSKNTLVVALDIEYSIDLFTRSSKSASMN